MNPVKWFLKSLPFFLLLQSSSPSDSITPQQSLKDGDIVVSTRKMFALGFFSPVNSNFRYVGIWFYQVTEQTVVWVANRGKPINDTSGILSIDSHGNLVIHQENQTDPFWSTNASITQSTNSVARLYDSGNLVLVQDGTHVWQSFDYPTDSLVPLMKFGFDRRTGLNRFLTSWKSANDPRIGNYSCRIDPTGFPQAYMYKNSSKVFRIGSWTGRRWSGLPEMPRIAVFNSSFVNDNEEVVLMIGVTNASILSRVFIDQNGLLQRAAWYPENRRWILMANDHQEDCDKYMHCGPNSNCEQSKTDKCSCLPGFDPKSPETWSLGDGTAGCIQKPNASICQRGEGFVKVVRVKVPDTTVAKVNMSMGLKQCEDKCLRDCSCKAYASAYYQSNGGTGCLTWHGDMLDMRTFTDSGQDFYVRVDANDLARYKRNRILSKKLIVAISIVSVAVMFCMAAFAFCLLRRIRKGTYRQVSKSLHILSTSSTPFEESLHERNAELPLFDLGTIAAATNNFSSENKLGRGGFGHVYKGSLMGKEVAVKRLSKSSGQGINEFKNEITLIAKLQHRNLVRILGCCVEKDEKILIYEYLPNKSLDSFIFDERKRLLLDWRMRYQIICGIARGIVYLHQDSRLRIIHRDLKASNILLDAEMNPKISDFGMAKLFGGDQIEANTNHVVGTYGYMAPEYAMQGHFSIKSDVYSFGVLLLEIITGRRSSGSHLHSPTLSLIGHVWDSWRNGEAVEIVDSSLGDSYPTDKVLRCIQIGLMCVQESAADRPKMSTVAAMLENEATLPSPKEPAFIIKKANQGDEITGSSEGTASIYIVTNTIPQGR